METHFRDEIFFRQRELSVKCPPDSPNWRTGYFSRRKFFFSSVNRVRSVEGLVRQCYTYPIRMFGGNATVAASRIRDILCKQMSASICTIREPENDAVNT